MFQSKQHSSAEGNQTNCQVNNDETEPSSSSSSKQMAVTFACEWDCFPESIIIDGNKLTSKSTMKGLLLHCDNEEDKSFADDNTLDLDGNSRKLYFSVKTIEGFNDIRIKKGRFLNMNIEQIQNLEHVHSQTTISIVDRK